jgi:predicted secreted Zn-dependent protease
LRRRSPRLASGALALTLALGGCGTALQTMFDPVVLKVERSTEYYDVRGVTSDEILEYLETHSLTDAQGRRLAGSTQSSWHVEWSALPGSASCYLQRLSILLKLVVSLPRHEYVDSLRNEARANWNRLVTHIAEHEQRYVDIELESAGKLQAQIRALPTASSCSELRFAIDAASKTHRTEARKAHRQFHIEDAARRRAEQEPIQSLIDTNRGRLAIVESEIWGLDRTLADLGRQRAGLTAANDEIALEQDGAVSRKAKLQEESEELRATIDSLVEKYKFTW